VANKDREAVQTGLNDLLGDVIKRDQLSAGRQSHEAEPERAVKLAPGSVSPDYDNNTDNTVMPQYDNMTSKQYDKQIGLQPSLQSHGQAEKEEDPSERTVIARSPSPNIKKKAVKPTVSERTVLEVRLEKVALMSEDAKITVTLRIPGALNEWLDEYVHRSWPNKIKKQDLIVEAIQLLYARRGNAGDEKLPTELLDEGKW
jgi:hypothetical protein